MEMTQLQDIELAPMTVAEPMINYEAPKKIGVLGGAFNPPHVGHLLLAEQVGKQLELDEVWFMPVAERHYNQEGTEVDVLHRLEMVKLAIKGNELFKLQPYELLHGGKLFTVDTMCYFHQLFPDATFYYLMGQDRAQKLHKWRDIERLAQMVEFVALKPIGTPIPEVKWPVQWVEAPMMVVSSTDIRLRVFLDQSIRYQVSDTVAHYIEEHQLYSERMGK